MMVSCDSSENNPPAADQEKMSDRKKNFPNILLISMDTVRRDHYSLYGYSRNTTPFLDSYALEGTCFDTAYSPTSTTGPSHSSIFTALYPMTHQVLKNGLPLKDDFLTMAEILSEQGYQTSAIVSSFALHSRFGYAQGFDCFEDDFELSQSKMSVKVWEGHEVNGAFDRRANFTTERAIQRLRDYSDSDALFFMFVHYFDPHDPYRPPEPYLSRFAPSGSQTDALQEEIGRYDGEIAFMDHEIGNLIKSLESLGLAENTLVILFGDHGEGLMQHGCLRHGLTIYEELVRVPLIFCRPGHIKPNKVVERPVSLVYLLPTILELTGMESTKYPNHGHSFASLFTGQDNVKDAPEVYLYRRHYKESRVGRLFVKGEKFGIRLGDWKYIEGPEEKTRELFDLSKDTEELNNLYSSEAVKAQELAGLLYAWRKNNTSADSSPGRISEDDLEKLKTLGYVE
ncbi:MAG: sulfatase [Sedimentisphaerales bacterium]|nr:sulfatase [Sedimentisphaerales bacterium]